MSVRANVEAMNGLILNGQILDAFEKFYAEDVVMQENNGEPRVGKAANRVYEQAFVSGLTAFKGAEVKALTVDEENGLAMVQWWMAFTHKNYGDIDRHQVSVQHWKNDKLVREQFFYN